ncbi:MAG: RAMP superfamily CRISPR-associated protein, partial [Candidatus Helarchaeota archaeon]
GTSIRGALARKAIVDNVINGRGNCKTLNDVNQLPPCANCNYLNECHYIKIWKKSDLCILNGLFYDYNVKTNDMIGGSPPVMNLESAYKLRIPEKNKHDEEIKDFLFYKYAFNSIVQKDLKFDLNPEIILGMNINVYKKSPANLIPTTSVTFKKISIPMTEFSHTAINPLFRTSQEGMLYHYQALNRGLIFRFLAIGSEDLLNFIEGNYKLGAGKSRGYGNVKITLKKKIPKDEYVKKRKIIIKQGIKEINDLLKIKNGTLIGSFTGVSPIGISHNNVRDIFAAKLKLDVKEVFPLFYKIDIFTRVLKEKNGFFVINKPVIKEGYSGVFQVIDKDIDELSEQMSRTELESLGDGGSTGWFFINHPIHYKLSILRGG